MASIEMPKMFVCMMTLAVAWEWPVSFGEKSQGAWVGANGEVHQDEAHFRGSESAGKKSWNSHDIRLESAERTRVEMRPSIMDGLEMTEDREVKKGHRRSHLTSTPAHEGMNVAAEQDTTWAVKAYAYGGNAGGHWNVELAQHFFDQVMSKPPDQRESEYHSIMATTSLIEGAFHVEHGSENNEDQATQDARGTLSQGKQNIWPTLEYLTPISAATKGMTPAERDIYWQKFKASGLGASDLKHTLYPGDTTGLRHDPDPKVHPLSHWTYLDNVEASYLYSGKQCELATVGSTATEMWLNMTEGSTSMSNCLTLIYENRHSCSLNHFNYDDAAPMPRPPVVVHDDYELQSLPILVCSVNSGFFGVGVWGTPTYPTNQSCESGGGEVRQYTLNSITITDLNADSSLSNLYDFSFKDANNNTVNAKEVIIPREDLRASGESDTRDLTKMCGCVRKHAQCSGFGHDLTDCERPMKASSGVETLCGKYHTSGSTMKVYEIVAVASADGSSPRSLCASTENYECTYWQGDRSCKHKICGDKMIVRPEPLLKCQTSTCNSWEDQSTCCEERDVCSAYFCTALGATPKSEDPKTMSKFHCAGTQCQESDRGICCNEDTQPSDPFAVEVKAMVSHFEVPKFATKCKHLAPLVRVDDDLQWPGTGTCSKVFASHPRLVSAGYEIPDACGSNNEKMCTHVEQVRECGEHMNLTCSCVEYCAKLNLPNLSHPECPNDVCDVAVQTMEGWCHFYTTYGCSVDDNALLNRVTTNNEYVDNQGPERHVVPLTNVMWRMVRTCDTPRAYECPANSRNKNTTSALFTPGVEPPEANLFQCCECQKNYSGFNKSWYHLTFDGCLSEFPRDNCESNEVYDLNDPDNCVPKTCARHTDTNEAESVPFDCTPSADGWAGSMEYAGADGDVTVEYHSCCKCKYAFASEDPTNQTLQFYGPLSGGIGGSGSPDSRGCEPLAVCTETEWEESGPSLSSNRVCLPISDCQWWEIELSAPTKTQDRVCGADQFYVTTNDEICDATPIDDGLLLNNAGSMQCQRACTATGTCKAAALDKDGNCTLFPDCTSKISQIGTKSFTKDFKYLWNDLNSHQAQIRVGDLVVEHGMSYSVKNNFPHNLLESAVMDGRVITFKPCVYDFNPTGKAGDENYDALQQEECRSQMPIQTADIKMPFYFDRVEASSEIKLSSLRALSSSIGARDPYDQISSSSGTCEPATTWNIPPVATQSNTGNKGFVLFGTPYEVVYGSCGVTAIDGLINGSSNGEVIKINAGVALPLQRRTNMLRVSTGQSDLKAELNVDLSDITLHRLSCATPNRDSSVGSNLDGGIDSATGLKKEVNAPWNDGGGWYDVQGCGMCFDWCRWVIDSDPRDPSNASHIIDLPSLTVNSSFTYTNAQYPFSATAPVPYWSCRLAGTDATYTTKEWLQQFDNDDGSGVWPVAPCQRSNCPLDQEIPGPSGGSSGNGECMCDLARGMGANDCRPGQYCYKMEGVGAGDGPTCNEVPKPHIPRRCEASLSPITASTLFAGGGNCMCSGLSNVEECPVGATCSNSGNGTVCTLSMPDCTGGVIVAGNNANTSYNSLVAECKCSGVECGIGQVCETIGGSGQCKGDLAECAVSPSSDIAPAFITKNCKCGTTAVCGIGQHCRETGRGPVCTGGPSTSGPGT